MDTPQVQIDRSFTLSLNAPPDVAIKAFGAVAEQGWDPDWHPRFIFPQEPEDREGAVFNVGDEAHPQTWLYATWDMHDRVVRYVAFDPGEKISVITITVSPDGAGHSLANVHYQRTGLSLDGDTQIQRWADHFVDERPHWQSAINRYLAG